MQRSEEKLCLQWNDFRDNISSAFRELRDDKDFTDLTLACEDGQQIEAHKMVLIASSPFFQNLLKKNKHPHPLIYMRGVKSEDLLAMVDFFYFGEANVFQENLDSFLALADELQLKGLTKDLSESNVIPKQTTSKQVNNEIKLRPSPQKVRNKPSYETAIVPVEQVANVDLEELDRQVKSVMSISENSAPGKATGRARICKVCGKEGQMAMIMHHIETKHMTGVAIPCNICVKTLPSRNALAIHKFRIHKNNSQQYLHQPHQQSV